MATLRLRRANDSDGEERTLRFPGSVRDLLSGADPRVMSSADLADSAIRTLDEMQGRLDELRREVDDTMVYRLPRQVGENPRPAA